MKNLNRLLVAISILALMGCSDSDDDNGSSQNGSVVSQAVNTASTVVTQAVANTSNVSFGLSPQAALNSVFADSNYGLGGDFGSTPRDFLLLQGNPTNSGNTGLMYRFNQNVAQNMCMFAYFTPSTGGVIDLSSGEFNISITAATLVNLPSSCPAVTQSELTNLEGLISGSGGTLTVRAEVTDVSQESGSQYDRLVKYDLGNTGTFTNFFYFRITSDVTRFSFTETADGGGGVGGSSSFFEYNPATGLGAFEYFTWGDGDNSGSNAPDGNGRGEVYRVLVDAPNGTGYYLARVSAGETDATNIALVVTTPLSSATELAANFDIVANSSEPNAQACVQNTDFSIDVVGGDDDTLACAGLSVSALAVSGFTGGAESTFLGLNETYFTGIDSSKVISFDSASNILTAAPSGN